MPEYGIKPDDKPVKKRAPASSPSSATGSYSRTSSSGTSSQTITDPGYIYRSPTTNNDYSTDFSSSSNTGTKTSSILLPLLFFIIGQLIQYLVYFKIKKVLLLDIITGTTPLEVLLVSSILGIVMCFSI